MTGNDSWFRGRLSSRATLALSALALVAGCAKVEANPADGDDEDTDAEVTRASAATSGSSRHAADGGDDSDATQSSRPACEDSAPCRLADNTTGMCHAGECGACAGAACAPVECSGDSACAFLDGPCSRGQCKAGACIASSMALDTGCIIDGVCVGKGERDPKNGCNECNPERAASAYSPRPAGSACDDGAWCTVEDACDGQGVCRNESRSCDDGLSCTTDSCDEASDSCQASLAAGCVIEGRCVGSGGMAEGNGCQVCDPARSTTAFSAITAAVDGDGCCPDGAGSMSDNDCLPVCGNGVTEGFEACDDGGAAGGCTDVCTTEPVRRAVAATVWGSCALTSSGKLACWGQSVNPPYPDDVFIEVCGGHYACALRPNGEALCFGDRAVQPPGGERFTHITCAMLNACGLRADGSAVCWSADPMSPLLTEPGERFSLIAGGGDAVCGLRSSDQHPVCWGWDGGEAVSGAPDQAFAQLALGHWSHCGIDSAGTATCWGAALVGGVNGASGIDRMSGGQGAMCVIKSGRLTCFGDDQRQETVTETPTVTGFDAVAVGVNSSTHACAITTSDKVYCWGGEEQEGQQDVPDALEP